MKYEVMAEPMLLTTSQVIVTLLFANVVIGAVGVAGTYAARITIIDENALNPYSFLA